MSAIQAFIAICILITISFWLERISDALSDIVKALGKQEKALREEKEKLEKALEGKQDGD